MAERYEIKGKLGRGGIGAVYRAYDNVMRRDVAIKRLLPLEQTKLNESADDSLKREAAALARLSHPNILTIYAFEEDQDGPYVVTELVDGENLKATIERGALPLEDFEQVVEQTLDPLIAAHSEGLLHRDLKPPNIMLQWLSTGRFQIKILDFGLAKFSQQPSLQTLDQTGSFLGSIDYIAPEQIDLKPLDARTDLYSMGCVYYYALSQRAPFEGKTPAETMQNHLHHRVTPIGELRGDLPKAVSDWVMRLISRHPESRPATAAHALQEFAKLRRNGATEAEEPEEVLQAILIEEAPPAASAVETAEAPSAGLAGGTAAVTPSGKLLITGAVPPARRPSERRSPGTARGRGKAAPKPKLANRAEGSKNSLRGPIIALIACLVIAAVVVVIVVNRHRGPDEGDSTTQSETGSGPGNRTPGAQSKDKSKSNAKANQGKKSSGGQAQAPPTSPGVKTANALPPNLPPAGSVDFADLAPPVTEGLVGHYRGGARMFREDLKSPAGVGQAVAGWGNLASEEPFHYLARLNDAERRSRIPSHVIAAPEEFPGLNGRHPMLRFGPDTGLRTRSDPAQNVELAARELSFICVVRTDQPNGHVIKFDGNNKSWNYLHAASEAKGYAISIRKPNNAERFRTVIEMPLKQFVILSGYWNGATSEAGLRLMRTNGNREQSPPLQLGPDSIDLLGYMVGTANKDPAAKVPRFDGYIAAVLIYSRQLSNAEFAEVETHLHRHYFAKQGGTNP